MCVCARVTELLYSPVVESVLHLFFAVTNADVACGYRSYPIYPFAFRTHTHHLGESFQSSVRCTLRVHEWTLPVAGKVVSGYRVRDGEWTLIGRQSPQLPQVCLSLVRIRRVFSFGQLVLVSCLQRAWSRLSAWFSSFLSSPVFFFLARHSIHPTRM